MLQHLHHLLFQPRHTGFGLPDRIHIFLEHNLLHGSVKLQPLQPPPVGFGPAAFATLIPTVIPKQKGIQPLSGDPFHGFHVFAGPREIPHRFLFRLGHPDGCELTSPMQPGQRLTVAPIRLHPITRFRGNQRRRHHHTGLAQPRQLPIDRISTRTRLITKRHRGPLGVERLDLFCWVSLSYRMS